MQFNVVPRTNQILLQKFLTVSKSYMPLNTRTSGQLTSPILLRRPCTTTRPSPVGRLDGGAITRSSLTSTNNCCREEVFTAASDFAESASADSVVGSSTPSVSSSLCMWDNCREVVTVASNLIGHLQSAHVIPQLASPRRKLFTCQWLGCRCYHLPSLSRQWLPHHVVGHTEAKGKPFHCIFDPCSLRFSTRLLLERHVRQCHMTSSSCCQGNNKIGTPSSADPTTIGSLDSAADDLLSSPPRRGPSSFSLTSLRRQRKQRSRRGLLHVRRPDFYDNRSRLVIANRIQLDRLAVARPLLSLHGNKPSLPYDSMPRPLTRSLQKSRRPRHRRGDLWSNTAVCTPSICSTHETFNGATDTSSSSSSVLPKIKQIRHRLLTQPHIIVGQRERFDDLRHHQTPSSSQKASSSTTTEYLVRWVGAADSGPMHFHQTSWVTKADLVEAAQLDSIVASSQPS